MSCGAPALCPAAQGFRDTVQHGVSGYLYQPRSLDDAEECLRKLISGAEIDRAAVLAAGEHMTIAGCAVRARKVYADAVATNRARSVRAVSCSIWVALYGAPTYCVFSEQVVARSLVILGVFPLAFVAGFTQMLLFYTVGLASDPLYPIPPSYLPIYLLKAVS